jgi:hypothetical protein
VPSAAAVVSDDTVAARNTPCVQFRASTTSGTTEPRRPPNRIASIRTPCGSSQLSAMDGHCAAGAVNRAFGCEDRTPLPGLQSLPRQSMACAGACAVNPSHHTSPSSVRATLVKMQLAWRVARAFGLVSGPVPGATPKKPFSGLIARSSPSALKRIQAMSSPRVSTFQPGNVGTSIARFVLPHADGKAAAMWRVSPDGLVSLEMSMCSASQPSSRAIVEAMRSA